MTRQSSLHSKPLAVGVTALAHRLGLSATTIRNWVDAGILPPPRRVGPRSQRWLVCEIEAWLESRPVENCLAAEHVEVMQAGRKGGSDAAA